MQHFENYSCVCTHFILTDTRTHNHMRIDCCWQSKLKSHQTRVRWKKYQKYIKNCIDNTNKLYAPLSTSPSQLLFYFPARRHSKQQNKIFFMWQRNLQFFINTHTHIQLQISLVQHTLTYIYKANEQQYGKANKQFLWAPLARSTASLSIPLHRSRSLPLSLSHSLTLWMYLISWQIYGKNKTADDVWKTMIGSRCRASLLAMLQLSHSLSLTLSLLLRVLKYKKAI